MSREKNYHSIMNYNGGYCYSWSFTGYCLLLSIMILFQGCSSNIDGSKIIENPMGKQIELIGAPKLVLEKTLYDFGEIRPNSKKTAAFSFTNLGDQPLLIKDLFRNMRNLSSTLS